MSALFEAAAAEIAAHYRNGEPERSLSVSRALLGRVLPRKGVTSLEALHARLIHAQMLSNLERWRTALGVVVTARQQVLGPPLRWSARALLMQGLLEMRSGEIIGGLRTLASARALCASPVPLGVVETPACTGADALGTLVGKWAACPDPLGLRGAGPLGVLLRLVLTLERAERRAEARTARATYETWVAEAIADHASDSWQLLATIGDHLLEAEELEEAVVALERARALARRHAAEDATLRGIEQALAHARNRPRPLAPAPQMLSDDSAVTMRLRP